jgi:DNA-directed RNA polymerase subunit M
MEFCPQCGSILATKAVETGTQAMLVLTCKKCGFTNRDVSVGKVDVKTIPHDPKQMVAVIDKEKQLSTQPTIHFKCPKCNNSTVFVWLVQTRGADESSTQFLRCTNCGHTFREYS